MSNQIDKVLEAEAEDIFKDAPSDIIENTADSLYIDKMSLYATWKLLKQDPENTITHDPNYTFMDVQSLEPEAKEKYNKIREFVTKTFTDQDERSKLAQVYKSDAPKPSFIKSWSDQLAATKVVEKLKDFGNVVIEKGKEIIDDVKAKVENFTKAKEIKEDKADLIIQNARVEAEKELSQYASLASDPKGKDMLEILRTQVERMHIRSEKRGDKDLHSGPKFLFGQIISDGSNTKLGQKLDDYTENQEKGMGENLKNLGYTNDVNGGPNYRIAYDINKVLIAEKNRDNNKALWKKSFEAGKIDQAKLDQYYSQIDRDYNRVRSQSTFFNDMDKMMQKTSCQHKDKQDTISI